MLKKLYSCSHAFHNFIIIVLCSVYVPKLDLPCEKVYDIGFHEYSVLVSPFRACNHALSETLALAHLSISIDSIVTRHAVR